MDAKDKEKMEFSMEVASGSLLSCYLGYAMPLLRSNVKFSRDYH